MRRHHLLGWCPYNVPRERLWRQRVDVAEVIEVAETRVSTRSANPFDDDEEEDGERPPSPPTRLSSVEHVSDLLDAVQEHAPALREFDAEELEQLAADATHVRFEKGETVIYEGEAATFWAVLLEGSLDVHLGDDDTPIASRGVGSVLGEASLFGGGLRNASLKAGADGVVYACEQR